MSEFAAPLRGLARLLWRVARAAVFVVGLATIALAGAGAWGLHRLARQTVRLPAHFVLTLDLQDAPPDVAASPALLARATGARPTLEQTIAAIDRAATDPRVRGIDILLGGGCCGLTTAEELHDALSRFRAVSHRQVVARAMSFDGAAGLGAYVVATAANRIELSDAGDFGVTGLALQSPFAADLLKMAGVEAQFAHIGKYKTYPELFTRSGPSAAATEMMNSLAGSLYESALVPIAARLKRSPDQVKALLDQAPFSAGQAKQDGLVDTVLPLSAQIAHVHGLHVRLAQYIAAMRSAPAGAPKVALIVAHGDINAPDAPERSGGIDPGRLAHEIAVAVADKSIRAIVLRLDTPGGTVTGSAMVGAEVAHAASVHKPLIVSMGALDASGGYWISSHGAVLVADPATLTGSIGVLGGKFSFGGLLARLGVNVSAASRGANALFDSAVTPWTPAQLASLQGQLDLDYQKFIGWVAAGRRMSPAQVNAVGQGRVWTGAQARSRGLVDRLGGYHAAFMAARALLHLPAGAPLDIVPGNAQPGLGVLIASLARRASPLGVAELPEPLRGLLALTRLHRLSMIPVEFR
ncbi:unnamed protein product [Acidocella sp. C78]|uniref:S49 family peptidase n=1 Tax=Acidocella sp. C78 TaxID=1671486 RepID=UPI00191B97D7|nr:S49 family peptidase [Acidocella sp. C78]CAG4928554.1 unnamed protein product [Acidocella sp. C78]